MIHSTVPYILVCGSYKDNRNNDKLCAHLGHEFATNNLGLISAGGNPAIMVAENMDKTLADLRQYDPFKIITVYRKKIPNDDIKVKRVGCNVFVGSDIHDVRNYLFSKAKVLLAIGGSTKTKEEILMAIERKIPVIPVAMTKGIAFDIWERYQRSRHNFNKTHFPELNNQNVLLASNAVISILKELISDD